MKRTVFQSIGVVLLAFVVSALLATLTDFLLEQTGVLPPPRKGLFHTGPLILVLFYRSIYTLFSGWILQRLAPSKPLHHALVLGVLGIILTAIALLHPDVAQKAPWWFGYALMALTIPCLVLGVKIGEGGPPKRKRPSKVTTT